MYIFDMYVVRVIRDGEAIFKVFDDCTLKQAYNYAKHFPPYMPWQIYTSDGAVVMHS
ncbi:hypothetical protein BIZ37_16405 [Photobacterium sp. BZF1]|uniref:hypothetical protein n=1 Tax=Photobacterium sp. BZF1 TaxID=1904457 RepID=UPI001653C6D1|nr:hypothetical protein [Photobacterium sp. BZF1]MBC7004146.1 hypothetical protein [Photobacterium sp. BZF1]